MSLNRAPLDMLFIT